MNIIPLIARKKSSQRKLARLMGKDPSTINRMMKPDYDPRFSTVMLVAESLGCSLDEIAEEVKNEQAEEDDTCSSGSGS